ncbi:MAG: hypothetical protein AAF577_01735 [Pseudomonadota bacterium]
MSPAAIAPAALAPAGPADVYAFWAARLEPAEQAAIAPMWQRFMAEADALADLFDGTVDGDVGLDVPDAMARILGPFDETVMWEFGPGAMVGADTPHALVLSSELNHEARPLMHAIMAAAPSHPRLALAEPRPPARTIEAAIDQIAGRTGGLTITGARVERSQTGTIDVTGIGPGMEFQLAGEALTAFSVLMGEQVERDWFGEGHGNVIDAPKGGGILGRLLGKAPRPDPHPDWLGGFRDQVTDLLRMLHDAVPTERFADQPGAGEVALYQLDPTANDWEGDPRRDTITYTTTQSGYFDARQQGCRMAARRYTRHVEAFLGLRLARTPDHPFDAVDARSTLSDALNAALRERNLGGVWGEGHGQGHVYLDFTTSDIEAALTTAAEVLATAGVTAPADILFDAAGLEERLLPLRPDSMH